MLCARRVSAFGLLLSFSSLLGMSSCLYDSGKRCDEKQIYNDSAGLCVCDSSQGVVTGEHGCVPCAEHQVAKDDVCSCEEGYSLTAGGVCEIVPDALGLACTKDADCKDATYSSCHLLDDGTGYCTNTGCSDDVKCTGGFGCATSATPTYCERPPSGAGKSCASDADCAGTEATFCETYNTHVCYVKDCSLTKNDCFPGKECCDLTKRSLGLITSPLCVDSGTCTQ